MSKCLRSLLLLLCVGCGATGFADETSDQTTRFYTQAILAQKTGNDLSAQNAARKYLAFCRLRPDTCTASRVAEMEALVKTASIKPPELPVDVTAPPEPLRKPPSPSSPPIPPARPKIDKEKLKRTSEQLARDAEMARERGQLEHALNLYRMAEKADPEREEFQKEIRELLKMME